MLAHAASSSALPCPLVSRLVSRQSRLRTLVFPGKKGGFAAEVVGFELSRLVRDHEKEENSSNPIDRSKGLLI